MKTCRAREKKVHRGIPGVGSYRVRVVATLCATMAALPNSGSAADRIALRALTHPHAGSVAPLPTRWSVSGLFAPEAGSSARLDGHVLTQVSQGLVGSHPAGDLVRAPAIDQYDDALGGLSLKSGDRIDPGHGRILPADRRQHRIASLQSGT